MNAWHRVVFAALTATLVVACSSADGPETRATQSTRSDIATIKVAGVATLDGEPLNAEFLGAVVLADGLVTPCQATIRDVVDGFIDIPVWTANAAAGCVSEGSSIVLWTYQDDLKVYSSSISVNALADIAASHTEFDSTRPRAAAPATNDSFGEVFDANGERVGSGRIEAHIGEVLCGVASIRDVGEFDGYILAVLVDSNGCDAGANIDMTVDGITAVPTIVNEPHGREAINLTLVP